MPIRLLLCLSVAAALAACAAPLPASLDTAVLPDAWRSDRADIADAARSNMSAEDAFAAATTCDTALPWWHVYGDRYLDAFIDIALVQNLNVETARHQLAAAHALSIDGLETLSPSLRAFSNATRDPIEGANFLQLGLEATWPLALPVERQGYARLNQGDLDSAVVDHQSVKAALAMQVVNTWMLRNHARQVLSIAQEARDSAERALRYQIVRVRLGFAAQASLASVLQERNVRNVQLGSIEKTLQDLSQALTILAGKTTPDRSWFEASDASHDTSLTDKSLDVIVASRIDRLPTQWLTDRLDVALARASVLRAAGALGIAEAEMYPRVALVGSWVYSHSLSSRHSSRHDNLPLILPTLDIPLWDWGRRRARREAREHELHGAIAAYKHTLIVAYEQAEAALAGMQTTATRLKATRDTMHGRRLAWLASSKAADIGVLDRQEQEAAARAYSDAQIDYVDAVLGQRLALALLYRERAIDGGAIPSARGTATLKGCG